MISALSLAKESGMSRTFEIQKILATASRSEPIFEPIIYSEDSGYDDFYPDIADEKIEYEENLNNIYCGNKVCWIGDEGKMMKVNVNYIYSIQGNQFYQDKLSHLTDRILSNGRTYLYAPYGIMSIVDIDSIKESLEYEDEGYEHKPLTTGDSYLDHYILNKDDFDEEESKEMEEALEDALASNSGDLGKQLVQIRDGNHRAFAAKAAGEDYIWIKMYENQFNDVQSGRPWADKYRQYLK